MNHEDPGAWRGPNTLLNSKLRYFNLWFISAVVGGVVKKILPGTARKTNLEEAQLSPVLKIAEGSKALNRFVI